MPDTVAAAAFDVQPTTATRLHEVDFDHIEFGKVFSDHMLMADFTQGAWQQGRIVPYGPMQVSPAMSALHYGQAIFEGLKAYKQASGQVVLFRPLDNLRRLNASAARLCMPTLPEALFLDGLKTLLRLDAAWVPAAPGTSLYIRPFMVATDAFIGVRPSADYRYIVFTSPVNSYYTQPLRVRIEPAYVRAAEGGMGNAKAAGNYAAAMLPARLGQNAGYHQLVWTDARDHAYIEESGTMNVCFVMGDKLITPALTGTILDGITRRSVLQLARHWGVSVEERRVSVAEVLAALQDGTLSEAFGCGTAATIARIVTIGHDGHDYQLPPHEPDSLGARLGQELDAIKLGTSPDLFGWLEPV